MPEENPSTDKSAVYLRSLSLDGFRCFQDGTRIDFTKDGETPARWTIILGENGTGKTAVLQAIGQIARTLLRSPNPDSDSSFGLVHPFGSHPRNWWCRNGCRERRADFSSHELRASLGFFWGDGFSVGTPNGLNWNVRIRWRKDEILSASMEPSQLKGDRPAFTPESLKLLGFGAGRLASSGVAFPTTSDRLDLEVFSKPDFVSSPENWLVEQHHVSRLDPDEFEHSGAMALYEKLKNCIIAVLPDVSDIRIRRIEGASHTENPVRAEFKSPYGWVFFEELGLGYQSMASWVVELLQRMYDAYGDMDHPERGPAVVLIDEFDLHMHPKWQLTLIDHLSNFFTNTQFIVTVHSPLVVQAAGPDANLVVLRREETEGGGSVVVADNNPVRVRGWRLDQLVTSDLFGLASSRPPEAEELFEERAKLVRKAKRSPEDDARLKEVTAKIEQIAPPSISQEASDLIRRLKAAQ